MPWRCHSSTMTPADNFPLSDFTVVPSERQIQSKLTSQIPNESRRSPALFGSAGRHPGVAWPTCRVGFFSPVGHPKTSILPSNGLWSSLPKASRTSKKTYGIATHVKEYVKTSRTRKFFCFRPAGARKETAARSGNGGFPRFFIHEACQKGTNGPR